MTIIAYLAEPDVFLPEARDILADLSEASVLMAGPSEFIHLTPGCRVLTLSAL